MNLRFFNSLLRKQDNIDEIKRCLRDATSTATNPKITEELLKEFALDGDHLVHKPSQRTVVDTGDVDEILKQEYDDLSKSAGLGVGKFYELVSDLYLNISVNAVKRFLKNQPAYQLTKPFKKQVNKPLLATHKNQKWMIDLIDMSRYSGFNNNHVYILTCVDVFTRYLFTAALKKKEAADVAAAMRRFIEEAEDSPQVCISDNGLEFRGELSELFKDKGVKQIFTRSYSPESNGLVEGINKIVRGKLADVMVRKKSRNWTEHLRTITDSWNQTKHSGMEHDPAFLFLSADDEVEEERKAAREHMEKKAIKKVMKTKSQQFQVGDVVRYLIATRSSELRKQQKTSRVSNLKWAPVKWTPELYRIKGIVQVRDSDAPKQKTQYTLENMNGRALGAGKRFFANQLQLVAKAGKRIPDGMDMDPDLARQLNRLGDEAQPQPAPRQRQPRQQPPPIPQPPRRGSRQRQAPQRPMQDSYVYEN
jgi:transposase InsO family protein